MIYNGKEVEFPAIMQVSFFKLIDQLEELAEGKDTGRAAYAKGLLKEVEKYPELKEGISDVTKLKKYQKSVDKLSEALFPPVLTTNEIKILTPPFYFQPIYTSKRFDNIVEASGEPFEFTMKDVDEDLFYKYCCYFIMGSYFGYPIGGSTPQFFEIENRAQGFKRTYKMLINAELSEFIPTEKAIQITEKDYHELVDNFDNMELWKKKFPPNSWIMRGVNIINLVDVTADQSIGNITSNLLVKSDNAFANIKQSVGRMLNNTSLSIGVISLENNKLIPVDHKDVESVLLNDGESLHCEKDLCPRTCSELFTNKEPLVVTDTDLFHELSGTAMSQKLKDTGFKSYIIAPLVHEDELLGFMELGSKNKYELNKGSLHMLDHVVPIISMAKKRFQTEEQNLVEAVIQQECTTIHSSVKWRFEEEALKFIKTQEVGEETEFKDIVFDNLYPLYGQLDIKGSSERRNSAVSKDLIKQLNAVTKIITTANKQNQLPVLEELLHRLDGFTDELKKNLAAGSEHRILSFLKDDVYPVFEYLKNDSSELKTQIENYDKLLDPELGSLYEERKKYDTSVNLINQRLASYLDKMQIEAQKMFPHYFERYKTDGVEFNMYIGQSITNNRIFNEMYLRNLRIWQLLVMCEMENEFHSLRKELTAPVEIASLILVYSTPLSVHFRMDEKKFDVEGAYNARYEIIKKRVDKAHIKGTKERITQPGHIVIVYSQEQDANEYRIYLEFLASKGYLKSKIEDVALEDLQGVHGLRALRVAVDYAGAVGVDELIREIEKGTSAK
ncbi:GAF domain-containing protein [Ekhidna sp. To15]|uniref:GAF domain-containing protein n=1 Tax=Ekhidna sp. To15 TaxID=3395267 RepID=UPI003F51E90B